MLAVDGLPVLEDAFAGLMRDVVKLHGGQGGLMEASARLIALAGRLQTVLREVMETHGTGTFLLVARQEVHAVADHATWLEHRAESADRGEVLHRFTAAASQGRTAVDVLQRVRECA